MVNFLRRNTNRTIETQEMPVPVPLPPVVHTPELERRRVENMLEAGKLVLQYEQSAETVAIAELAYRQAENMSQLHGLPFDEILAGIPDYHARPKAS